MRTGRPAGLGRGGEDRRSGIERERSCDPGHSFCCTEGVLIVRFSSFPKIKLGSKLIDHRLNKLKGVSSEGWCIRLDNS
jgi:hypothetical protein